MTSLDAIKARADELALEDWLAEDWHAVYGQEPDGSWTLVAECHDGSKPDGGKSIAEFIAAARSDVPRLLAAIEAVLAIEKVDVPTDIYFLGYNRALNKVEQVIHRALEEGKQ